MWKKNKRSPLTLRLSLLTMTLLGLVCGILYWSLTWAVPSTYLDMLDNTQNEMLLELTASLKEMTRERGEEEIRRFFDSHDLESLVLTDGQGEVLAAFGEYTAAYQDEELSQESAAEAAEAEENPGEEIRKTYRVSFRGEEETYFLEAAGRYESVNQVEGAFQKVFPGMVFLVLLAGAAASAVYSLYVARPIVKLEKMSAEMTRLNFEARWKSSRKDEIGSLGEGLNELSQRLSKALGELQEANEKLQNDMEKERKREQKRLLFFSAVSHELKTPIAIVRGQVEGMICQVGRYKDRDTYLKRVLSTIESMEGLVKEILAAARAESVEENKRWEPCSLEELISETEKEFLELFRKKGLLYKREIPGPLYVQGNPQMLKKALTNLWHNAFLYSPEGAKIRCRGEEGADGIKVELENTGVHLPEESLEHLFEPFYRVEQSRNRETGGSGLGLYLVRGILEQQEGKCRIENTEEGVKVTLCFPNKN